LNVPSRTSSRRLSPTVGHGHRDLINRNLQRMTVKSKAQSSKKCVTTKTGIQQAVRGAASISSSTPTRITICTKKIDLGKYSRMLQFDNTSNQILFNNITDGIDVTDKRIIFDCYRRNGRCTLDGVGITRHFYGSNASVTFRNIQFVNGFHTNSGGALLIQDSSFLRLTNCLFANNSASLGGALSINRTNLVVDGKRTLVRDSRGGGTPIEMYTSTANLNNVLFQRNNISQFVSASIRRMGSLVATLSLFFVINPLIFSIFTKMKLQGGGILMLDSKIDLINVDFVEQQNSNCDVFVPVFKNDFTRRSSCLQFS
jgi:hypothetical protein